VKIILKLEAAGLLTLFTAIYFHLYLDSWGIYLALFFVPDISFLFYLLSNKVGAIVYNIVHHQGILVLLFLAGFYLQNEWMIRLGLIFLAHSSFDRAAGYGLKYFDGFNHTHLGYIGKNRASNINKHANLES
jgi:hypothetical protein